MNGSYVKELEDVIIDLTDALLRSPQDIFEHTGINYPRCQEIAEIIDRVYANFLNRRGDEQEEEE